MEDEHQNPEPGKRDGKASRGQAEGEQTNPPERLAYSIASFCKSAEIGRSTAYEEIKAGHLIARKVRGRTIILPTDARNYLLNLPTTKDAAPEPEAA